MDLHAAQIQGFFDVPVDHLYAAPVIDDYVKSLGFRPEEIVVVSPDEGSIKRALPFLARLGGGLAIVDKRRTSATQTEQANLIGDPIEGKVAFLFDDMITTAGSMVGAAEVIHAHGAREIYACATHAVLCGPAVERLRGAPIKKTVVTNTIPVPQEKTWPDLTVLSVAPLLGEAIKRIHRHESVSKLFESS